MNTEELRKRYEAESSKDALIDGLDVPTRAYFNWLEERYLKIHEEVGKLEEEAEKLEEKAAFLDALNAAGVDNWEGYDIAQDMCSYETD